MRHMLRVREDIRERYRHLFGDQLVNGRPVNVEQVIARIVGAVTGPLQDTLTARYTRHASVTQGQDRYGFLDGREVISDADGETLSVATIRQGMLDGFLGRASSVAWRVGETVAIPAETMRPGLEGTGPAIDLGMAMGALNSGASSWMWDWEDAGGDFRDQLYAAWTNLKAILAHEWDHRSYAHPTKLARGENGKLAAGQPRNYRIEVPSEDWPVIFHRVPGLHLRNRQITLNGADVPAIVPALVIHAVNNFDAQRRNGSGIYYYIPKIESWQEARVVASMLKMLEDELGLARGTLKIKVLNERAEFVLQQEVIQWILRENLIGANVGRWDYLNSREEMFRHDPSMVIPNPTSVAMTEPSMTYYTRRNAILTTLAGAMPIGGMAAQMPNPKAPQHDAKALRDIWFDKLRERLTGLFVINGRLFDTYRQSWVATTSRDYVAAGREPLIAEVDDLQAMVDQLTNDERGRLEALGILKEGRIAYFALSDADLSPDTLFSEEACHRLLARPNGPTTEDGMRYAMYMATEYMYQQLQGNNAAAIDDPITGLRFMNDLATYEIFWHFLYLTVLHGVKLTADGKFSRAGDAVTPDLFMSLLVERRANVKDMFAKRGIDYASTDAELVLEVLKQQVLDTSNGSVRPQRWIKYGSRVLLSLVERTKEERQAVLEAIGRRRDDLAARVREATDPTAGERAKGALKAHDYIYDVFESAEASAAADTLLGAAVR